MLALFEARLDDAIELADRTEMMNDRVGDQELQCWVSVVRGAVALTREDAHDAARHASIGVQGLRRLGGWRGLQPGSAPPPLRPCHAALLYSGIIIAGANNREAAAVRLLAAAAAIRKSAGIGLWPRTEALTEETLASLRARLAPDHFAHEWQSGQEMTIAEAISKALVELDSCQ
jgi:hypothetical protein